MNKQNLNLDPYDLDVEEDSFPIAKKRTVTAHIGDVKFSKTESGRGHKHGYKPVADLDDVQTPSDTDKISHHNDQLDQSGDMFPSTSGVKQYQGPRSKDDFITRMKKRNENQSRILTKVHGRQKPVDSFKSSKGSSPLSIIGSLRCNDRMKKFIKEEFLREKQIYTFLPESQVVQAVIHRYRTHLVNVKHETPEKCLKSSRAPKRNIKLKGRSKPKASVESDENSDDLDIEDFSDDEAVPEVGTFSLSPSNVRPQTVLMRYADDEDSFAISDSSQDISQPKTETETNDKAKLGRKGRKSLFQHESDEVKPKKQKLSKNTTEENPVKIQCPILSSSSQDDELEIFSSQDKDFPVFPNDDVLLNEVASGYICGSCHKSDVPLRMCSACTVINYCDESCQRNDWPQHKRICKYVRNQPRKKEAFINFCSGVAKTNKIIKEARDKKRKSVTIKSQPVDSVAPGFKDELFSDSVKPTPSNLKSILKNKVQVSVVLSSPPIYPLEHHVRVVLEGSQEERFDKLTKSSEKFNNNLTRDVLVTSTPRKEGISDDKFDQLMNQLKEIHSSPEKPGDDGDKEPAEKDDVLDDVPHNVVTTSTPRTSVPSTPVNSPSLTASVRQQSCARVSFRSLSRVRGMTPHPRRMLQESDHDGSFVKRKIKFSNEDQDYDNNSFLNETSDEASSSQSPVLSNASTVASEIQKLQEESVVSSDSDDMLFVTPQNVPQADPDQISGLFSDASSL